MPKVHQRAAARRDLLEHFVYLAENADLETAERFLANAEATFGDLARQPRIGAPVKLSSPELAEIRIWRIRDFDNHLIFYVPRDDGVSIVRVLHAARDRWGLLGLEQ